MLRRASILSLLLLAAACAPKAPTPPVPPPLPHASLTGGWWHLVEIRSRDVVRPTDPLRYTVTFHGGGAVDMQLDCNKGRGKYSAGTKGEMSFGPIAVTKMFCGQTSLGDRVGRDMGDVRSYAIDGNQLSMKLSDGSSYVWQQASLD